MGGGAMNRRASWLPVLPGAAWRLLAGEILSAAGSRLTLPFVLVYLHEVGGAGSDGGGVGDSSCARPVRPTDAGR
jgi:hypothetical protein